MTPNNLEELRKSLDLIDRDLFRLLDQRAGIARQIWSAKRQLGSQIAFSPVREAEIFKAIRTVSLQNFLPENLESIFIEIVSACRATQNETQICFLGEKHGWVNDAATTRYGQAIRLSGAENFEDFIGSIDKNPDLLGFAAFSPQHAIDHLLLIETLFSGKLSVVEEYNLFPEFSIVSNTARDLSEVHEICVTTEILQLLRSFFISLSFDLKIKICRSMTEAYENLQSINPVAAILPARLVNSNNTLRIIKSGLKSDSMGPVKFLTLAARPITEFKPGLKTTLLCAVNNTSDRLFNIMTVLSASNLKVCDIHSLRFSGKPWESVLQLEILLPETQEKFISIMKELENRCLLVKACGFYPVFR